LNGSNTVFTDDIANDTQPASGGNPAGGLVATDLRPNSVGTSEAASNSLTGTDINESTLVLNGFFEAESAIGFCHDDQEAGSICASTGITLAKSGQLLLTASGNWYTVLLDDGTGPGAGTDATDRVEGRCALRVDGTQVGVSQSMGERGTVSNHPGNAPGTMALTGLSPVLLAGNHSVDVFCTELDGDLDWQAINLTASRVDN
jgi:hypothetical protein